MRFKFKWLKYIMNKSGTFSKICQPLNILSGSTFLKLKFRTICFVLNKSTLEIKNCSVNGGLSVPDASTRSVQSVDDVLNLMKLGEKNRVFSSTALNNRSSRSHRFYIYWFFLLLLFSTHNLQLLHSLQVVFSMQCLDSAYYWRRYYQMQNS